MKATKDTPKQEIEPVDTGKAYHYFIYKALGMDEGDALRKAGVDQTEIMSLDQDIAADISKSVVEQLIKIKTVDALQTILNGLNSKFDSVRLSAAQDILDRAGIVKKQKIEQSNLNATMDDEQIDKLIELKQKQLEKLNGENR